MVTMPNSLNPFILFIPIGNKTEDVVGGNVEWLETDRIAAFLDLRTISAIPKDQFRQAAKEVEEKYVDMCLRANTVVCIPVTTLSTVMFR